MTSENIKNNKKTTFDVEIEMINFMHSTSMTQNEKIRMSSLMDDLRIAARAECFEAIRKATDKAESILEY